MIADRDEWEEDVECSPMHRNNRGFISSSRALTGARITLPCHVHEQCLWQNERIIKCGPRSNDRENASVEFHQPKAHQGKRQTLTGCQ